MLCRPTNVAAASCHALLPLSSHLGDGTSITCSLFFAGGEADSFPAPKAGRMRVRGYRSGGKRHASCALRGKAARKYLVFANPAHPTSRRTDDSPKI